MDFLFHDSRVCESVDDKRGAYIRLYVENWQIIETVEGKWKCQFKMASRGAKINVFKKMNLLQYKAIRWFIINLIELYGIRWYNV